MRVSFQDARHLISLVGLFAAAVGVFVILRAAVVPEGIGKYGHYRAGAIDDNRARAVKFAGQAECVYCHDSQLQARNGGRHKGISCEACHGPQARHVASDGKEKPAKPDVIPLCLNCHEKDAAKPAFLPQVVKADHYTGTTCSDCHQPHNPKM